MTTIDPDDVAAVLAAIDAMSHDTIPILAAKLSPDVDGMVVLLQDLRRAMAQLRWAAEELEDEIVKVMPRKDMEVMGVGAVTLRTGTKRTEWQKDAIVAAVTARIADEPAVFVDEETGEFLPPAQAVERVLAAFLSVGTPSWKVTGMRAMHLDPDEFCSTSYGRKTVQTPTVAPWPDMAAGEAGE